MKRVAKAYKCYKIASKLYRFDKEYKELYEAARDAYVKSINFVENKHD